MTSQTKQDLKKVCDITDQRYYELKDEVGLGIKLERLILAILYYIARVVTYR